MPRNLPLGIQAKDVITGFQGTITGHVRYLTGCDQYVVTPKLNKDGEAQGSQWFDESRLEVTDKEPVKLPVEPDRDTGPGELPTASTPPTP